MSYIVMHPSEVEHWKRLFAASGMTLTFQCPEPQPQIAGTIDSAGVFQRYEIDVVQRAPNRAARRAVRA